MKSIVALVGRPNVGKSTLFNHLTRSRDALVSNLPGLTRDRLYGTVNWHGHAFTLVDTGGLAPEEAPLQERIGEQTRMAASEADAIIFLVDARAGLHPRDEEIAAFLRTLKKPVLVAANKAEGQSPDTAVAEFYALGLGEPVAIAAAHGEGTTRLLEALPKTPGPEAQAPATDDVPRIAIVGRPNAGKSTLVNTLLGEQRVVVADMPGTTRDSVRIPLERDGRQYLLIDTAGMRRRARVSDRLESYSVIKALRAIQEANVAILVLDARREISGQDANLVGYILEAGKGLVLAVNKWDGLPGERRREIRDELDRKLNFISFAPPVFISARHGSGLGELLQHVNRAWSSSMASFGTSYLNRILEKAITANPPPRSRGRRIRLKFAHQCGHNPPRIRIHGTQAEAVPQAYRRFLENTFRRALELEGTPLGVEFSSAANPYAR